MKFVLGFSGPIKSGKTTIARRVAEELSVPFASFGDYLRTVVAARGLDSSDRTILQRIGQELFESDLEKFCRAVLENAGWSRGSFAVVDGIRHVHVLKELKRILESAPMKLVFVSISEDIQCRRLAESGSSHSVAEVESHTTEADVRERLFKLADIHCDGGVFLSSSVAQIISSVT